MRDEAFERELIEAVRDVAMRDQKTPGQYRPALQLEAVREKLEAHHDMRVGQEATGLALRELGYHRTKIAVKIAGQTTSTYVFVRAPSSDVLAQERAARNARFRKRIERLGRDLAEHGRGPLSGEGGEGRSSGAD